MEQLRLLIAVVLSFLVFFVWNHFMVKKAPQIETPSEIVIESTDKGSNNPKNDTDVSDTGIVKKEIIKNLPVDEKTYIIETDQYIAEISSVGAKIRSFKLKKYNSEKKENSPLKELIDQDFMGGSYLTDIESSNKFNFKNANYFSSEKEGRILVNESKKSIIFESHTESGLKLIKEYVFYKDSYLFDCNVSIINSTDNSFSNQFSVSLVSRKPKAKQIGFVGPAVFANEKLKQIDIDDIEEEGNFNSKLDWGALESIYFITALIPDKPENMIVDFNILSDKYSGVTKDYIVGTFKSNPFTIDSGGKKTFNYHFYLGPKRLDLMEKIGFNLKKSVNFGFFDSISKPCLLVLNFIYKLIPNYGISIILLTLLVKIIFWPLGTKSAKSMDQMKKIQPLMTEIREKYKNDKQKMNQEIMNLYKTYKVNPLSGCLPILVQIPIFFGLYRMLFSAIELRHAPFMLWLQDLSAPDRLLDLGAAIPFMSNPDGIPLLTIIMGASMYFQQKMTPTGGDPTQAKMMMFMPVFITIIFVNLPAGLVLYMLVNNIFSMGQQFYVTRSLSK